MSKSYYRGREVTQELFNKYAASLEIVLRRIQASLDCGNRKEKSRKVQIFKEIKLKKIVPLPKGRGLADRCIGLTPNSLSLTYAPDL